MDRADRSGAALAVIAHLLLFAALSIGIAHRPPPVRPVADTMDVQLIDTVGLRSAAPAPAPEAPQEASAPEIAPPQEAPPPPPAAAPAPRPVPAPPKPVADAPQPKPAKPAPTPLSADFLKDVRAVAKTERAGRNPASIQARAGGSRLGPDFLKGIAAPAAGKSEQARAAVTGAAMNGLAAAIKRQVQPCYELGGLGGTPAMRIVTILRLRFTQDGSVAGTPQVVRQDGVDPSNRAYQQQIAEVARRAVLRCSPLRLPAELYAGGWEDIQFTFRPAQMQ